MINLASLFYKCVWCHTIYLRCGKHQGSVCHSHSLRKLPKLLGNVFFVHRLYLPWFNQTITINKEIKTQQGHTSKRQMEPHAMVHTLPISGLDLLLWLRSPLHRQRLLCAGSTLGSRVTEKCTTTWLPFRWETGIPQRGNRSSWLSYLEILGNSRKFLWLLPALLLYLSGEL